MIERKEFEEWLASSCSRVDVATHHAMWTTWQAARASRWRSMESAPNVSRVLLSTKIEVSGIGRQIEPGEWWDEYDVLPTPIAWHPLPDPPTKEELEKLK